MELRHYLAVLRRRAVLLLVLTLAAGALAWLVTPKTPRYSSEVLIYVGATNYSVGPSDSYRSDPTALVERLMVTYAEMLDSEPLAADAIRAAGVPTSPEDVVEATTVAPREDTQLLAIEVVDDSPVVAQSLVNGLADGFIRKAQAFEGPRGPGSLPSIPAYIFQRADSPGDELPSPLVRNLLLALLFGLLTATGVAFLLDHLDLTIKDVREAEKRLQLPVLGFIPFNQEQAAGVTQPVSWLEPMVPAEPPRPGVRA